MEDMCFVCRCSWCVVCLDPEKPAGLLNTRKPILINATTLLVQTASLTRWRYEDFIVYCIHFTLAKVYFSFWHTAPRYNCSAWSETVFASVFTVHRRCRFQLSFGRFSFNKRTHRLYAKPTLSSTVCSPVAVSSTIFWYPLGLWWIPLIWLISFRWLFLLVPDVELSNFVSGHVGLFLHC